jgi:hypothetical protein
MPPERGSPKVLPNALKKDFFGICGAIHNYSFEIFAYRVNKRKHKLSDIRGYIEQAETSLVPEHRSRLLKFLRDVDAIITHVTDAQATKQLPTHTIKTLLSIYRDWTNHNIIPQGGFSDNKRTLLDMADEWLAKGV